MLGRVRSCGTRRAALAALDETESEGDDESSPREESIIANQIVLIRA
jgi:hypothetical protein